MSKHANTELDGTASSNIGTSVLEIHQTDLSHKVIPNETSLLRDKNNHSSGSPLNTGSKSNEASSALRVTSSD